MRNGLKFLMTMAVAAGVAACDTAGDDVEVYEGEEAATPSLETRPADDVALMTAQFQPADGATEAARISGTVRILQAEGLSTTDTPETDTETGTETEADLDATTTNDAQGQGFRVEAEINGLAEGDHAWHIHSAPCGQEGPVVVAFTPTSDMEGLSQPLTAGQDGSARGSASVPSDQLSLDRLQSGQYSLHVHTQGGVDHGPTVACADLTQGTTTTM